MEPDLARRNMVEHQLRAGAVLAPRVLDVLRGVRREDFVPSRHAGLAFAETAIPLACGQRMLPPRLAGLALQALDLQPGEHVLEIGTGSGFLTACMARLAGHVDSMEIHAELADAARAALGTQAAAQPAVTTANAWHAEPEARYDAVVLTASLPAYDPHFEQWLKPGGRLFAAVGCRPVMEARMIRLLAPGQTTYASLFELDLDAMIGPDGNA